MRPLLLSDRRRRTLCLVAAGWSHRAIAQVYGCSRETVTRDVRVVADALGLGEVASPVTTVIQALKQGFITLADIPDDPTESA